MKKRIALIPLGIVAGLLGITSLALPFMINQDMYGEERYFAMFTCIGYPKYFGNSYYFAAILLFIFALSLLFLYCVLIGFSIASTYKRRLSTTTLVLFYTVLGIVFLSAITQVIIVALSRYTQQFMYLYFIFAFLPLIPLGTLIGLNHRDYKQMLNNPVSVLDKEKVAQVEVNSKPKETSSMDAANELAKWKALLDDNAITLEEYNKKKEEILNR